MSKWIVDIHGDIEGDYDLICKADDVLDKIRAEIEQVRAIMDEEIKEHDRKDLINFVNGLNQSLMIIDKYKKEVEK